ncbi:anti-sigma factor domain-containing protein [Jannaschia sp. LMIT008]|uniref:anti-sigma factor n=1 Tax=Jannaschia maritima TaxID=3032585 RepID=UPI002811A03F|nr:anti-sigma factor [Jannaschia sp. LMIT008]
MTDELDPIPEDERDDVLAAEYALGLLEDAERDAARRRAGAEPDFAARVLAWEARLAPLGNLAPVPPPAAARAALHARLFPDAAPKPFWRRAGPWQVLAGAALALAVAVLLLVSFDRNGGGGPLYPAEIASEAGDFRVIAVVDKTRDEVVLTRTAGAAPPGRVLQVWAHGPDEPAQSVGLWPAGETVRLPLPPEIAAVRGTLTLGVSEEPPGGSPTGSPSGRVFGTVDIPGVGPSS